MSPPCRINSDSSIATLSMVTLSIVTLVIVKSSFSALSQPYGCFYDHKCLALSLRQGIPFFHSAFVSMLVEKLFYENAYIINLRRREDRWAITNQHLLTLGFNSERFEAVDGNTIPDPLVNLFTTPEARESLHRKYRHEHHEISRGSVGCSMSHFALWRRLLDSDKPHMTIFEDDAECLHRNALSLLPFGRAQFDVLLLGGIYNDSVHKSKGDAPTMLTRLTVKEVKQFLCLHAYVIWKEAAWRLLQFAFPIQKQVDFYMYLLPTIKIMACVPSIFHQRPAIAHTDIQTPIYNVSYRPLTIKSLVMVITGVYTVCIALLALYFRIK